MTFEDIGYGLCGCGVERRLYRPEEGPVQCATCTVGARRKEVAEELIKAQPCRTSYSYHRARRERLALTGKCIDCGRMPPMSGIQRCRKCHTKMLDHNRHAKGAA